MRRATSVAVLVIAVLTAACGNDDGGSPTTTQVSPPASGTPSQMYGVPLPAGAVTEPDPNRPGAEAFRLPEGITLAEADAFFTRETDGKALQGFDWCGKVLMGRLWTRPGTGGTTDQLEVVLDDTSPPGVVVRINQTTATGSVTCPPPPPEGSGP